MTLNHLPRRVAKAGVKRYGLFLRRYPLEIRQQRMQALRRWQWLHPTVEEVQLELDPPSEIAPAVEDATQPRVFSSLYPRYVCQQGEPLSCTLCQPTTPELTRIKHCLLCGFPTLLPPKAVMQGLRGRYQIESWLGQRGNGRMYRALQLGTNQPVVIKEYVLPSLYFDAAMMRQQQAAFKNLAGLSLADGRVQDSRLVVPIDAIADDLENRCYLVMNEAGAYPPLSQYLRQGAFTNTEVRWLLNQVLQTLEFLHGQKYRLPSGLMQTGIAHGNLNLHSLLIGSPTAPDLSLQTATLQSEDLPVASPSGDPDRDRSVDALLTSHRSSIPTFDVAYFIYLCDLALWEQLFVPMQAQAVPRSINQDLVDLGYVAFYLLAGKVYTPNGDRLDPRDASHWQTTDLFLKHFILRLMQLETPFESAEVARRELTQSPPLRLTALPITTAESPDPKARTPRWIWGLLSVLGLGLLAWLIWLVFFNPRLKPAIAHQVTRLQDVGGIPPGTFRYTATQDGIWHYVLQQPNLIQKGQTLEQQLQLAQPKLQLNFQPTESPEAAIAQVRSGAAAFAVVPLITALPDDLEAITIAHDGLAIIVSYNYSNRDKGLPTELKGTISLEQLQQLYQARVTNWKELGVTVLPVNLYQPQNRETVLAFQQRVFPNQPLMPSDRPQLIRTLPEFELFRTLIRDFEADQIGSIGFSSLSKVVGQCSVYPLALKMPGGTPIQAVVLNNNQAIAPSTDLCDRKGSYRPSVELIRSGQYPLAYPIAIVFPRRNDRPPIGEKFAEMLKTQEGQTLLRQTGLVPLND